ncbi:hypothetical protein AB4Z32_12710 [Massilia sp. 2TAF26]|uniref:hypothetical protein n=1 Tax=Massilia sp. 2TAF26 TaxID=3233012 RepID=UPI003F9952F9
MSSLYCPGWKESDRQVAKGNILGNQKSDQAVIPNVLGDHSGSVRRDPEIARNITEMVVDPNRTGVPGHDEPSPQDLLCY